MKYDSTTAFKEKKTTGSGLIDCPHCGMPINVAKLTGKMALGHQKKLSPEEIQRRTKRLAEARQKRWKK